MTIFELVLFALGFSMDATAVAMCKGLSVGKVKFKHMIICGLWFGGFQALMPLIGYFLGEAFEGIISPIDHWIVFVLLGFIGGKMIFEAIFKKDEECDCKKSAFHPLTMFTMAIATSIDAMAAGITYATDPTVDIVLAVSLIGVITFLLSAAGVKIGAVFGAKYKFIAELVGGITLVGMGIKILVEHLFFGG